MNDVMNPEIKAEWLAALRSGNYTQTNGALRREDKAGGASFCCLGVLCDVLSKDGRISFVQDPGYDDLRHYGAGTDNFGNAVEGSSFSLPDLVCELVGISTDAGEYVDDDGNYRTLIGLNDSHKKTFEQIADVIEANF